MYEWTRVTGRPDPRCFRCFADVGPESLLFKAITDFKACPLPAAVSLDLQLRCMSIFSDGWPRPASPPPLLKELSSSLCFISSPFCFSYV